jgi:predicted class III extradiol MEMO1 family dioxygenase
MAKIDTTKAAAQAVAEKLAKRNANNSNSSVSSTSTTAFNNSTVITDKHIPGLLTLTPDLIPGMMPAFKPEDYRINDPLNPPETLPQATQSQLDKGMRIYEGATRALKLTGAALDLTREKFTVVGKHSKAFGAGIQAATEIEKVKGNYLDYANQKEVTTQKSVVLDVSQVKTIADRNIAIHSKDELNQKLLQAQIKAEDLRLRTVESQGKLVSFKAQLGDYLEVKTN